MRPVYGFVQVRPILIAQSNKQCCFTSDNMEVNHKYTKLPVNPAVQFHFQFSSVISPSKGNVLKYFDTRAARFENTAYWHNRSGISDFILHLFYVAGKFNMKTKQKVSVNDNKHSGAPERIMTAKASLIQMC